jgi:hypothetical protein
LSYQHDFILQAIDTLDLASRGFMKEEPDFENDDSDDEYADADEEFSIGSGIMSFWLCFHFVIHVLQERPRGMLRCSLKRVRQSRSQQFMLVRICSQTKVSLLIPQFKSSCETCLKLTIAVVDFTVESLAKL